MTPERMTTGSGKNGRRERWGKGREVAERQEVISVLNIRANDNPVHLVSHHRQLAVLMERVGATVAQRKHTAVQRSSGRAQPPKTKRKMPMHCCFQFQPSEWDKFVCYSLLRCLRMPSRKTYIVCCLGLSDSEKRPCACVHTNTNILPPHTHTHRPHTHTERERERERERETD